MQNELFLWKFECRRHSALEWTDISLLLCVCVCVTVQLCSQPSHFGDFRNNFKLKATAWRGHEQKKKKMRNVFHLAGIARSHRHHLTTMTTIIMVRRWCVRARARQHCTNLFMDTSIVFRARVWVSVLCGQGDWMKYVPQFQPEKYIYILFMLKWIFVEPNATWSNVHNFSQAPLSQYYAFAKWKRRLFQRAATRVAHNKLVALFSASHFNCFVAVFLLRFSSYNQNFEFLATLPFCSSAANGK